MLENTPLAAPVPGADTPPDLQKLTRKLAVELAGADAVDRVERAQVEFTSRQLDGLVEFAADVDVDGAILTAYYYQSRADVDAVQNLDELSWHVARFALTF